MAKLISDISNEELVKNVSFMKGREVNMKRVAWAKFENNRYFVKMGNIVRVHKYYELFLFAKRYNANIYIVNTGEFVTW